MTRESPRYQGKKLYKNPRIKKNCGFKEILSYQIASNKYEKNKSKNIE